MKVAECWPRKLFEEKSILGTVLLAVTLFRITKVSFSVKLGGQLALFDADAIHVRTSVPEPPEVTA